MIYKTKIKIPEKLLEAIGFEKAPDRGWQIITLYRPYKKTEADYRKKIPFARFHALVFLNEIDLHYDRKGRGKHHKTSRSHPKLAEFMIKIKELEDDAGSGNQSGALPSGDPALVPVPQTAIYQGLESRSGGPQAQTEQVACGQTVFYGPHTP